MSDKTKPRRAFVLKLEMQADTRDDLVQDLEQFAHQIDREEISVGVSGSPSGGSIYSLSVDESITHEQYVNAINAYIASLPGEQHE